MILNYTYTITDASHYDAFPLMTNWDKIAEVINGGVDEGNVTSGSKMNWAVVTTTGGWNCPLLDIASDLNVHLTENRSWILQDESGVNLLTVAEDGTVTIGE